MRPSILNNWLNSAQQWLFPLCCILCDASGHNHLDLCANCLAHMPRIKHPCPLCGQALSAKTHAPCGSCQKNQPHFSQLIALFAYQAEARYLIQRLKYHRQMPNARLLGQLMAQHVQGLPQLPQALIPVPLHRRRILQRGFNQSAEIAHHVSRLLDIPLDPLRCQRVRDTASQSQLNAKQRRQNVKQAFSCQAVNWLNHVAIVDDVVTTGATVNELARTLLRAGVKRVDVWSCARA